MNAILNFSHYNAYAKQNLLLAGLPDEEWSRFEADLEPIDLQVGKVLYEPGIAPSYVIFPTTAVVSLLYTTQDGTSSEIAVIGNEGVVGVSLFMGGSNSINSAVVQSAGVGYRMRAQTVRNEASRAGPVLKMLLQYTESMIGQVAQTAACNRHHSIDQQLSRRLLQGLDRLLTDELMMTHESLANLLGVRRESVTAAALKLQQAGIISYSRGRIEVLNRPALEKRSCECYAMSKLEHKRLLPNAVTHRMASQPRLAVLHAVASPQRAMALSY